MNGWNLKGNATGGTSWSVYLNDLIIMKIIYIVWVGDLNGFPYIKPIYEVKVWGTTEHIPENIIVSVIDASYDKEYRYILFRRRDLNGF